MAALIAALAAAGIGGTAGVAGRKGGNTHWNTDIDIDIAMPILSRNTTAAT
jgi:hypothetical protein